MTNFTEDFALWCRECVKVTDNLTGLPAPFILNAPQRRVLRELERQRRAGRPIRLIMLKARQWGGSTLVQVYMSWMQLVRRRGWNSLICGHVKDASANIRGMYSQLLRHYPEQLKRADGGEELTPKELEKLWSFAPFEKSQNINHIPARECRVTVASALAPNAVRGGSYHMAHLSEVAFWGDGDPELAGQIVRSVSGSIPRLPDTLVVMESTADGEDNFFHDEWQRAVAGQSDKVPVFVPWHEIEAYRRPVSEAERDRLFRRMDSYEADLLRGGVPLEAVAWYHEKRKEYATHEQMMAEYPSTPDEAFTAAKTAPLNPMDFY
ncbi:MAG: hypothetical protein HDS66_04665 [Bacteroidales bacterium]|nr:hypothetical protein [Bacteroidales bacterium]